MRRFAAITLLLLLLLTTGGRALLFELRLAELRQEMRALLSGGQQPEGVETFLMTPANSASVHWLEDGKEFEKDGERYDVLQSKRANGVIEVQAVADKKETALLHQFRKDQKVPPSSASLVKLLSAPFLPAQPVILAHIPVIVAPMRLSADEKTQGRSLAVITPPPQAAGC